MPTLTVEVTDSTLAALRLRARQDRVKPETVAAELLEDRARESVSLHRRFRDAMAIVDRRLNNAA